jgi:cytochrome c biogenesis protein CcdA
LRKRLSILCHLGVLLASLRWSCSTSGLAVMGLGVALLFDKYVIRLLPWGRPVAWKTELCSRCGYFLLGAAVSYWIWPGIVPVWEAAFRGGW